MSGFDVFYVFFEFVVLGNVVSMVCANVSVNLWLVVFVFVWDARGICGDHQAKWKQQCRICEAEQEDKQM